MECLLTSLLYPFLKRITYSGLQYSAWYAAGETIKYKLLILTPKGKYEGRLQKYFSQPIVRYSFIPSVYSCHHSNKTMTTLSNMIQCSSVYALSVFSSLRCVFERSLYLALLFCQTSSCLKTWIRFNSYQVLRNRISEEKLQAHKIS